MLDIHQMELIAQHVDGDVSWLQSIDSDNDYQQLLKLIDTLFENYNANLELINLLSSILEKYEETADCFKSFNEKHKASKHQASMLWLIMEQHKLTPTDFCAEHLSDLQVAQILAGKLRLTHEQVHALANRFSIPAAMFMINIDNKHSSQRHSTN